MKRFFPLLALAVGVAGAYVFFDGATPVADLKAPQGTHAAGQEQPARVAPTMPVQEPGSAPAAVVVQAGVAPVPVLSAQAHSTAQQLDQLGALPAGDAAIDLGRQLEDAYRAETAPAYIEALLATGSAAVERTAISALARNADSPTLLGLVRQYGSTPAEQRGRILQVLEAAANPGALDALVQTVAADKHEKRSALFMSAMYGMASIGTVDSVNQLLQELGDGNADYALMALERVHTRQGIELIRAAAEGGKGNEQIAEHWRAALRRIAGADEAAAAGN